MNWSNIENRWNDYKANAKQQWSKLTDEQLNNTMGKREQLSQHLQKAYGLTKEDSDRQISDWQSKQADKQAPAARS